MSQTILYIATSLDGFVAGKNDDVSWLMRYNDVDYGFGEFFSHVGAIIQGRRTYDVEVQDGWENAHSVPTFVLTHRSPKRKPRRSDVVFTREDIAEVLKTAKRQTEKDIWIEGGASVAQQFLKRGLLDQIVLSVAPTLVGAGIRLFDELDQPIDLMLVNTKQFDKGLIQLTYARTAQTNRESTS